MQSFFDSYADPNLSYHNAGHTREVIAATLQMAQHYQLDEKDTFIVTAAAWFHDAGYYNGTDPDKREEKAAEIAGQFLSDNRIENSIIEAVQKCILATGRSALPVTLLEKIVCDADLFYLGAEDFAEKNKALRKETEALHHAEIGKDDWRKNTIQLMEVHRYHTEYGQSLLENRKSENLVKLMRKDLEKSNKASFAPHDQALAPVLLPLPAVQGIPPQQEPTPPKEENKKTKRPERGIETVFRTTSSNNQQLSNQADNKAHIMIQVNAIVISVLLSILLSNMGEHRNLMIPIILLLIVNVVTIIFAMLATRPNIPTGRFTHNEIDTKKVNLLFFGNFYKMGLDEYMEGMLKMMDDYDFLYRSLIRDVYHQGVVLGKKYQLLRLSYSVFMYGLVVSVIAFVVVFITVQF